MKTLRISCLAFALACGGALAQDGAQDQPSYPRTNYRIDAANPAVIELLEHGGLAVHEATRNGMQFQTGDKCNGPDFNKEWPSCNHEDLQFFPIEQDCPGTLAIVTGGSGACQNLGGLSVPLVEFYGDDWTSWWPGARRCRTQDVYQVGEWQEDGTTGLTATSTTLWQVRPWKESGKPLPAGFDPGVEWMEAQCSGFLEIDTFGYNGGN